MKNSIVYLIRYSVILLPVLFLVFLISHIHNHTQQNNIFVSNHISEQTKPLGMLSSNQRLQSIMQLKKDTLTHDLLPSLPIELKLN